MSSSENMFSIPYTAYIAGFLVIALYLVFLLRYIKTENRFFSSHIARRLYVVSARIAMSLSAGISRIRDVFFVMFLEEGLIENLFLRGIERFFNAVGNIPMNRLDGSITFYMVIAMSAITAAILFL